MGSDPGVAGMSPEAEALRAFMSELSEKAYSAGWMSGLEYDLWKAVVDGPRRYGRLEVETSHISRLRQLAQGCSGWIFFDEATGEKWIPIEEWKQRYSARA